MLVMLCFRLLYFETKIQILLSIMFTFWAVACRKINYNIVLFNHCHNINEFRPGYSSPN